VTTIVETERMKLREFEVRDLDELAAMVGDAEQMTFYPRRKTREEASAYIDRNRALYDEYGFGFWCLESRATGAFLGYCGIRPRELDGGAEIEIGWHTKKAGWNSGLATEAATAARDLAFNRFDIARLVAVILPQHIASRRVAAKIGMRVETTTVLDGDYPALVYARERSTVDAVDDAGVQRFAMDDDLPHVAADEIEGDLAAGTPAGVRAGFPLQP
jgi:RimJ/RimL family protein N-acetyltransferase